MFDIVTNRLRIAPTVSGHFEQMYIYSKNDFLYKYFEYKGFQNYTEFKSWILKKLSKGILLSIISLENGRCIGSISLDDIDWARRSCSIGYALDQDFVGNGFFSEALKAVVDELRIVGFHRIWAVTHHENEASIKALRNNGFLVEGQFSDYYHDGKAYSNALLLAQIL